MKTKTIIHIDDTHVLVPKRGCYGDWGDREWYSDELAAINVDWWNCEDEIEYTSTLKHPVATLGDLQPYTIGGVHRNPEKDEWWEFGFTLSPEYAFHLLRQQGSVPADAELFQPHWRTETHPYCTGSFHKEDCAECV